MITNCPEKKAGKNHASIHGDTEIAKTSYKYLWRLFLLDRRYMRPQTHCLPSLEPDCCTIQHDLGLLHVKRLRIKGYHRKQSLLQNNLIPPVEA